MSGISFNNCFWINSSKNLVTYWIWDDVKSTLTSNFYEQNFSFLFSRKLSPFYVGFPPIAFMENPSTLSDTPSSQIRVTGELLTNCASNLKQIHRVTLWKIQRQERRNTIQCQSVQWKFFFDPQSNRFIKKTWQRMAIENNWRYLMYNSRCK